MKHILVRARPKEILLALSESLSEIEDETDGRAGLSDEEEGDEVEGQASPEDLIVRLDAVLSAYIQGKSQSSSFLSKLIGSGSAFEPTAIHTDLINPQRCITDNPAVSYCGDGYLLITKPAPRVQHFGVDSMGVGPDHIGQRRRAKSRSVYGECLNEAILTNMLYMAITLLSPRIDANLAERWFLARFPRYRNPSLENADAAEGQSILDGIKVCS